MKKSVAMKWAKALESGKYKQADGYLRTPAGDYCCLGVLCDLVGEEVGLKRGAVRGFVKDGMPYNATLPSFVSRFVGMKSSDGLLSAYGRAKKAVSLSGLNDIKSLSFNQIARVIRRRYKDL